MGLLCLKRGEEFNYIKKRAGGIEKGKGGNAI